MKDWLEDNIRGSLGYKGTLSNLDSAQMSAAGGKARFGSIVIPSLMEITKVQRDRPAAQIFSEIGIDLLGCEDIESICGHLADSIRKYVDFDVGRLSWRPLDIENEESGSEFKYEDLPEFLDFSAKENILIGEDPLCLDWPMPDGDGPQYLECQSGTIRAKTLNGDPLVLSLRSALTIPLDYKGERIGQLALFSSSGNGGSGQLDDMMDPYWNALGYSLGRILEMESLRRERDRSRDLLDGTEDMIVVWRNLDSIWEIDCNRKAEEMFDITDIIPDMMDGPFFVPPGKEWERAVNAWNSTFESGRPTQIDLQLMDRTGSVRSFLCKFRAIHEDRGQGSIIGVRMTGVEMETLDSGIRQLESTNRTYRLLLSVLSHDLKNPLSAVRGYAELMEYSDNESIKEYLKRITSLTKRMADTISLTNTYAQLQEGRITSEFESIDLMNVVDNCLEILNPKTKNYQVRFDPGDGVFEIRGHKLLEQVVLNLLDNAMKYSDMGTEIKISLDADLSGITLSVSDRGLGVPDSHKTSIFDRFSRIDENSGIMGAGLGLAISKGICDMHGGRIWVEDNTEGGSVFRVFLPWEP
jgi:signal transduction histidine kinase